MKRAWQETKDDNISLLAAGVAFFAFLAIFPALIAAVSIYGLIANPADVTTRSQVNNVLSGAPQGDADPGDQCLLRQTSSNSSGGALSIGLVVSILGALWSASPAAWATHQGRQHRLRRAGDAACSRSCAAWRSR